MSSTALISSSEVSRRVVFLTDQLGIGGTEGYLRRLVHCFEQYRVIPLVFSLGRGRPEWGGEIIPNAPVSFGGRRGAYDPLPLFVLARKMRSFQPDSIITFTRHAFMYALVSRKLAGLHFPIYTFALETHGRVTRSANAQLNFAARILSPEDRIVVQSNVLLAFMRESWSFSASQFCVIPLGVDVTRFHPQVVNQWRNVTRQQLGIPKSSQVLGIIANLSLNKNHEMTFRVLRNLREQGFPDIRLLVVGTGYAQRIESLRALSVEMGLGGNVLFVIAKTDVCPYLSACDITLLTSRAEATPTVVLESLACEIPIVVTAYASASEQLGSDLENLVIPQDHEPDFTQRVSDLLSDPAERRRIGQLGRLRVVDNFTMDLAMRKWSDLVCAQRNPV